MEDYSKGKKKKKKHEVDCLYQYGKITQTFLSEKQ